MWISVIDDDESVRTSITMLLNSAAYQVQTFASADDFLHSSVGAETSCLILDVGMPGVGGLELQHRLLQRDCHLPIIFITACEDPEIVKRAMQLGAIDVLHKPFKAHVLLASVQVAVNLVSYQRGERNPMPINTEHAGSNLMSSKHRHQAQASLPAGFIDGIEREQRLIAEELHDTLNQELAIVALDIGLLERQLPNPCARQLHSLRLRIQTVIDNTRAITRRLHPSIIEHIGLIAALRVLCETFSASPANVTFKADTTEPSGCTDIAIALYRVAQEGVRNAIRHSGSKDIHVTLSENDNDLILSVQDFGRGFDNAAGAKPKGLGLRIMSDRVRLHGGTLSIRSAPGQGTLITARVPIPTI